MTRAMPHRSSLSSSSLGFHAAPTVLSSYRQTQKSISGTAIHRAAQRCEMLDLRSRCRIAPVCLPLDPCYSCLPAFKPSPIPP